MFLFFENAYLLATPLSEIISIWLLVLQRVLFYTVTLDLRFLPWVRAEGQSGPVHEVFNIFLQIPALNTIRWWILLILDNIIQCVTENDQKLHCGQCDLNFMFRRFCLNTVQFASYLKSRSMWDLFWPHFTNRNCCQYFIVHGFAFISWTLFDGSARAD